MTDNKYQLHNDVVQQIMNNPPHVLITWGNTVILLILGILFFVLNTFRIHEKATLSIRIGPPAQDRSGTHGNDLVLLSNMPLPQKVKEGQWARLSIISSVRSTRQSITEGSIHRVTTDQYDAPVIHFSSQEPHFQGQPGMIGTLQIKIDDRSLLSMLLDKLRL
jgi:hypothetical protein